MFLSNETLILVLLGMQLSLFVLFVLLVIAFNNWRIRVVEAVDASRSAWQMIAYHQDLLSSHSQWIRKAGAHVQVVPTYEEWLSNAEDRVRGYRPAAQPIEPARTLVPGEAV